MSKSTLKDDIIEALQGVYDPEIPVSIYELGLIYKIEINKKNVVNVDMTLTTPNCPVAETLPKEVKKQIARIKTIAPQFEVTLSS